MFIFVHLTNFIIIYHFKLKQLNKNTLPSNLRCISLTLTILYLKNMRNSLLVFFVTFCTLLISCSKEKNVQLIEKIHTVSVGINNGFTSDKIQLKSGDNISKSLAYYLYKDGSRFKNYQDNENFESIKMLLTKGVYKLGIFYNELDNKYVDQWFLNQSDASWYHLSGNVGNLFYKVINFEVTDEDLTIPEIELKRLSSKISLTIQNIPTEVARIEIKTYPTTGNLVIQNIADIDNYERENYYPIADDVKTIQFDIAESLEFYTLPMNDSSISIVYYNSIDEKINTMDLNNITVERNYQLNLSGEYTVDGNFNVDIVIDQDWNGSSDGSF